jgi:hypothetical protein
MTQGGKILVIAFVAFTLLFSVPAWSTVISLESGSASIGYNTSTVGSKADPWTIAETFTTGPVVLKFATPEGVSGSPLAPGNPTGSGHTYGKWIQKTVTNNTGVAWTSLELEVQSTLGIPSTEGDGLSFAQGGGLTFSSDIFTEYTRIDIERDYLNFHGGTVDPGETVNFWFAITDNSTNNPIWLAETANKSEIPEPATMLLLGSGLVGLAGFARKRLKK